MTIKRIGMMIEVEDDTGGLRVFAGDLSEIVHPDPDPDPVSIPWLEDQPIPVAWQDPDVIPLRETFPRWDAGSPKQRELLANAEQIACHDIVPSKPYHDAQIVAAQAINPDLMYLRIWCPTEHQGWDEKPLRAGSGFPFQRTGPASDWRTGTMFAGHWAYGQRTRTKAPILAGESATIEVQDAGAIKADRYACLFSDGWHDAEHVFVQAVNGTAVTISTRGVRSDTRAWLVGTWIATHRLGQPRDNRIWSYNVADGSPRDANDKQCNEVLAEFIIENFDKLPDGSPMRARCDGILFDSDMPTWSMRGNGDGSFDADGDGIEDDGIVNGVDLWHTGLEHLTAMIRGGLDARGDEDAVILTGDYKSDGFWHAHGGQLEAFPDHEYVESGAYPTKYPQRINEMLSIAKVQDMGRMRPRIACMQSRAASLIDNTADGQARDNRPVRLNIALSCMFDSGLASFQNGFARPFRYYDYYAVRQDGSAVAESAPVEIRKYRGWMGHALKQYERIYEPDEWRDDSPTLIWRGFLPSPDFTLEPGVYTLCTEIRSELLSHTRFSIGWFDFGILGVRTPATNTWMRHVLVRALEGTARGPLIAETFGEELGEVRLFRGNANVFRRDFEHGVAFANASPERVRVDLPPGLRKIRGNQDPSVDDGSAVDAVILEPWDGIILQRIPQ